MNGTVGIIPVDPVIPSELAPYLYSVFVFLCLCFCDSFLLFFTATDTASLSVPDYNSPN